MSLPTVVHSRVTFHSTEPAWVCLEAHKGTPQYVHMCGYVFGVQAFVEGFITQTDAYMPGCGVCACVCVRVCVFEYVYACAYVCLST